MTGETYTHGHHESVLRSHTWRTAANSSPHLLPRLRPGMRLLDVGCGPGTITADLARLVAPGHATGIDRSPDVVEIARSTATGALTNLTFEVADLHDLPFPDDTFDVVHAHQVLQHLADPVHALAEMRRVCRPDGIVAARDADYASFAWAPLDPRLDRWLSLYRTLARHNGGEPDAARHLLAWCHAAGFSHVEPSASAWCFATPEDRSWWGTSWADRIRSSAIATQLVELGWSTQSELDDLGAAFLDWAADPSAWFAVLHGEVVATP